MNKLKGIIFVVLFACASIMMPFSIYASGETQIVPTYTSSTTQQEWQTKIRVTNYCEGTNASTASCKLQFYVTGNYYGIIYVDGYDSSGTHWLNGTSIFVSGGYGEYNYNFYQNGIKAISSISIWAVSLVVPDSNVDLTQIISLLTSINSYENQNNVLLDVIDDNTLNTVNEIKNVISQLIVSNGYLDIMTKLRQFNIPFESFSILYYPLSSYVTNDFFNYNYVNYPLFNIKDGQFITRFHMLSNSTKRVILLLNRNVYNIDTLNNFIGFENSASGNLTIQNFKQIKVFYSNNFNCLIYFEIVNESNGLVSLKSKYDGLFCPIYESYLTDNNISTEFALQFGLSNRLLDNLNIIANGTAASNNASQQLDSDTSDFNTDRDDLIDIEDSMGNSMDSAMNQITPNNNGLSGFGGNFLTSAVWVRTQFERLTNNTPYGSLIVYGMTLGLALLLLGKVML